MIRVFGAYIYMQLQQSLTARLGRRCEITLQRVDIRCEGFVTQLAVMAAHFSTEKPDSVDEIVEYVYKMSEEPQDLVQGSCIARTCFGCGRHKCY